MLIRNRQNPMQFVVRENDRGTPEFGTMSQAKTFYNHDTDNTNMLIARYRGMGFDVELASERGNAVEPNGPPVAQPTVSMDVAWPGNWRISPIERGADGKFYYRFVDYTGQSQRVVGTSPQDVVDRLELPNVVYQRHIASLPDVSEAPPQVAAPAPQDQVPGRILRPGSRAGVTQEELDEMNAARDAQARQTPVARQSEAFKAYMDVTPAREIKKRYFSDPVFAKYVDEN